MKYKLHLIHYIFIFSFAILNLLVFNGCAEKKSPDVRSNTSIWYQQAQVELGSRIIMFSESDGVAISRGRGNLDGSAYKLQNGKWVPFYSFPYSDYPLIQKLTKDKIWTINHLSHDGNYKPLLYEFLKDEKNLIPLPKIMWDKTDHVMWKGISIVENEVWLAGQQGNIIHFDRKAWLDPIQPVKNGANGNLFSGDLNDIFMTSKNSGWAVGRDGIILRYDGSWKKFPSPVTKNLERIFMINENLGWITGQTGMILKYNGTNWEKEKIEAAENLYSVTAIDSNNAWAVGENSSLFMYDGKGWIQDSSVKLFEDTFNDISVVKDNNGKLKLWIIGLEGIYTNSQTLGFSFTDYTSQASIRRSGKNGIFFPSEDGFNKDLLVLNEGGNSFLYRNETGNIFNDQTSESGLSESVVDAFATAIADVNNDGFLDLFQILNDKTFKLFLGKGGGGYIDFTERSKLKFNGIESYTALAAYFIDFDKDGNTDLYLSNYDKKDFLFKNDGAGQFYDISQKINTNKIAGARCFGIQVSDFNNDGFTDILYPYQSPTGGKLLQLYLNKGNFVFEEKQDSSFITESGNSLSTSIALAEDLNNDGYVDILVHHQKAPPWILYNRGDASFRKSDLANGLNDPIFHPQPDNGIMNCADINNDGWEDVFISSKLFLNNRDETFREISNEVGINFTGDPVFADAENDGDIDLFIGSSRRALGKGDRTVFYRNNLDIKNSISILIEGDKSVRSGEGTRLNLTAIDRSGKHLFTKTKFIGMGNSPFSPQNISTVNLGLSGNRLNNLEIIFPSGITKKIYNIKPGDFTIFESSGFNRQFILTVKAAERTLLLINYKTEIVLLLIFILIGALIVYFASKTKAFKGLRMVWFILLLSLTYSLSVHFNILNPLFTRFIWSFIVIPFSGILLLAVSNYYVKKKESNLISHFRLDEEIGTGGMGKVYKAIDVNTKSIVAMKILHPDLYSDPENKRRFNAEGQLLSSFSHPNIVKVYELGEAGSKGFIVMELLSGGTLKGILTSEYPMSLERMKFIFTEICNGLVEIHNKGIIHRDLKPNNIMFDTNGNLRIMDFGLSKSTLISTLTSLGSVLGTLGYTAPEQVTNVGVDFRTDIFSFGAIMYECSTKEIPFKGENEIALIHSIFNLTPPSPSTINNSVPEKLDKIIMKCLSKDRQDRYSSATELKADINLI